MLFSKLLGFEPKYCILSSHKFLRSMSNASMLQCHKCCNFTRRTFLSILVFKFMCSLVDQHCCNEDGTTRPLLLVTASVDRMVLKKPISVDTDLSIVGAVTWVGRSSMEIQLEVIQATNGSLDDILF